MQFGESELPWELNPHRHIGQWNKSYITPPSRRLSNGVLIEKDCVGTINSYFNLAWMQSILICVSVAQVLCTIQYTNILKHPHLLHFKLLRNNIQKHILQALALLKKDRIPVF